MEMLRQYVISVAAAAMICGVVTSLFQTGTAKEVVKLICGLFLAFTVLSPVSKLDFSELTDFRFSYSEDAAEAAALGENLAQESMADIIKAETEAYILDKAEALNAVLTVEVTVSEENLPMAVKLSGEVSPYARQQLQAIIQTDLGIAKENQQWTG